MKVAVQEDSDDDRDSAQLDDQTLS